MRLTRWIVDALSALAAVVFAYYGAITLWGTVAFGRMIIDEGSGGLGAVSAGFTDIFPIALIAALALNVLLAKFARRSGGAARTLHRVHSIALACLLVYVVLLVLLLTFSLLPGQWFASVLLIIAAIVSAQFWLLALLLIAFIRRPAAPMAV